MQTEITPEDAKERLDNRECRHWGYDTLKGGSYEPPNRIIVVSPPYPEPCGDYSIAFQHAGLEYANIHPLHDEYDIMSVLTDMEESA